MAGRGPSPARAYVITFEQFSTFALALRFVSDSFADLSEGPTPSQPQKKVGSTVPPRGRQYDVFSILFASQPSGRPIANNQLNDRYGRQPQQTLRRRCVQRLVPLSLDDTAANRNPDRVNMTMAGGE